MEKKRKKKSISSDLNSPITIAFRKLRVGQTCKVMMGKKLKDGESVTATFDGDSWKVKRKPVDKVVKKKKK